MEPVSRGTMPPLTTDRRSDWVSRALVSRFPIRLNDPGAAAAELGATTKRSRGNLVWETELGTKAAATSAGCR